MAPQPSWEVGATHRVTGVSTTSQQREGGLKRGYSEVSTTSQEGEDFTWGGAVRVSTASLDGGPHVGPPGGLHTITRERGLHTGDHEGLRNSCYRTLRLQSRVVRKWGGPLLVSQEILAFWLCCVFVAMQAFL